jgi:hypothetical protein
MNVMFKMDWDFHTFYLARIQKVALIITGKIRRKMGIHTCDRLQNVGGSLSFKRPSVEVISLCK